VTLNTAIFPIIYHLTPHPDYQKAPSYTGGEKERIRNCGFKSPHIAGCGYAQEERHA